MKPLVTVVMATYNGEQFLAEAIESVLDQTYRNFEFIIVDDGSTDNTAQIIKAFEDDRIKYVRKEKNSGIADSLNLGISIAKGKYIARIDDDDVCMSNRFEKQVAILEKREEVILCTSNVILNKDTINKLEEEVHEDIKMQLLFNNAIVHPTVMIRKEVLLKHKYNPKKVPSEDYDLWSRLIWEGEFYKIREPLIFYRYHKLSETSQRRKEQLLLNVNISKFMFHKLGIKNLPDNEEHIRILASHDYSISGKKLPNLINWFRKLKQANANDKLFEIEKFNNVANANLERFIISFFINQKLRKKIMPFIYLTLTQKILIIKYYFKKLFQLSILKIS